MRRIPLFILVAMLAVVAAVGVALAITHGTQAAGSEPAAATPGGADTGAMTQAPAGNVPPSRPDAEASAMPPPKIKPKPATHAASTSGGGGDNTCWDDCGDPGGSNCTSSTGAGHTSTGVVDDDGDGDGGDCGDGD
jgi:hypothetical protein